LENTQPQPSAQVLVPSFSFSWTAPLVPHHERSSRWYAIGGVVVLSAAAFGIVTGNWTFSLVSLLVGAVYFLLRDTPPLLGQITITEQGVQLQGSFTRWSDCDSFWLITTPTYTELHIAKKQGIQRELVIQTGNTNIETLRQTLIQVIPEHSNKNERLVDLIIRLCKL
jgi:hypothetical protein